MTNAVKNICACPYYAHTGFRHPVTKEVAIIPNPRSNQCPFFILVGKDLEEGVRKAQEKITGKKIVGKVKCHAPCVMETEGKTPDWGSCPLQQDPDVVAFLREEFRIMH